MEFAVPWSTDFDDDDDSAGFTYPIFEKVERGERPTISKGMTAPPGYVSLMRKCWSQKVSDRPTFNMIVPVLRNMRNVLHVTQRCKNSKIKSKKPSGLKRHSMPSRSNMSSDLRMNLMERSGSNKNNSSGGSSGSRGKKMFQMSNSSIALPSKSNSSLSSMRSHS